MIPSIDVLREMIAQGVEDWVFGYARGAEGKFQAVKIGTALEKDAIEFAENAFLLKAVEFNVARMQPSCLHDVDRGNDSCCSLWLLKFRISALMLSACQVALQQSL